MREEFEEMVRVIVAKKTNDWVNANLTEDIVSNFFLQALQELTELEYNE